MKLTNKLTLKRNAGMTLLELTVVILVLLSLISILFVGARAWKKGSDRAGCIMNIRNVQQAVRGHANMNNLAAGVPLLNSVIYSDASTETTAATTVYMKTPVCPAQGVYAAADVVPATGTLYLTDTTLAITAQHEPADHSTW